MSATSRIAMTAFFISARSRGVLVHGNRSQGIESAISCFSFEGRPLLAESEQLWPVFAPVGRQPQNPYCLTNPLILRSLSLSVPTSARVGTRRRGIVRFADNSAAFSAFNQSPA